MRSTKVYDLPLWRTAWRRMRRRPFQYIIIILGVALGVAMMVSIDLASGSASRAFQLSTDTITGKATHRIVGDTNGVDQSIYVQLRVEEGISPSAPIVEGYVLVEELGEQPIRLVGVDLFAEPPFRAYLAGQAANGLGNLTPFLVEENTIVLAASTAEKYGVALGDEVSIQSDGRAVPMKVIGLMQANDDVNRRALSNIIFTDIANAQNVLNMNGRLSHIDLIVENDAQLIQIQQNLPSNVHLETASARSNAIQQMTAAFELNLTALSLLALVVGMFLIYNTVSFSVIQRRPLFGVLRCLGVTGNQLFRLILVEAAVFGFVGSLLGLLLGVVLGRGMVTLVTQTINDLYFVVNVQEVTIPLFSLAKGLVIGIGAAVFASAVPAMEALRTPPQSTLRRSTIESKAKRLLPWLSVAWLLLFVVGMGLLLLPTNSLIIAFAGLFAVLFSFALLTPPVTAVLMRIMGQLGTRLFGALGRMAPRDIVRSLSRTSVAIAALMMAVSVVVGVSIMIGSFRQTVTIWLGDTLRADVYLSPPRVNASDNSGFLAPEVVAMAESFPGVAQSVAARQQDIVLPNSGRIVALVAANGDVSQGQRQYLWLSDNQETVWQRVLAGEGVLITEPLLRKNGNELPPEPVQLMTPTGVQTFPVLGVYYDYTNEQGLVQMGLAPYQTIWQDDAISTIGLFLEEGISADALIDEMGVALNGRNDVIIQSNKSLRESALIIFDRTFAITSALRLLAIVVAFIGILSALMSLQLEKTRELGVLRATGMTIRQLWQLTLLETGLMGFIAGLLALPTGYVLAWILVFVINVRSFGWTLQMNVDYTYFLQAFIISIGAALLGGLYPAWQSGKTIIATAVRQE